MSGVPSLTLYYFDIAGKGEPIRLTCAYAGIALNDVRFKSREDFTKLKDSGKLEFGQVPCLEVNGERQLVQSATILRYLGKMTGRLYPQDDDTAAIVDSVLDHEQDMMTGITVFRYPWRYGFDDLLGSSETVQSPPEDIATNRATVIAKLNDDIFPKHFSFLEALIAKGGTGFVAGTPEPTIADFVLAPRLEWLLSNANPGISSTVLDPFPRVKALVGKVFGLEKIKNYYASRGEQNPLDRLQ